jgi:hypothetical protein
VEAPIAVSPRGLLILTILLAAAVLAVLRFDRPPADARGEAAAEALLDVVPSEVTGVEIAGPSETISLARTPDGWRLGGRLPGDADAREVESLLEALVETRIAKTIEERSDDLARYGLSPAQRRVVLTRTGHAEPLEILLGRSSPVNSQRYVSRGGGRVLLVDGSFATAIERKAESFREFRLLPVEQGRIRRIEIVDPRLRVVLVRRAGAWWIEAPYADRADFDVGERIAHAVEAIRFDGVEAASAGGLGPARRIAVRAGEDGPEFVAEIALAAQSGFRRAYRWRGDLYGRVSPSAAQEFEGDPEALREKRLASFPSADVREVSWTTADAAWTARRESEGAGWSVRTAAGNEGPAGAGKVEALMDAARTLRFGSVRATPSGASVGSRLRIAGASGPIVEIAFGPSSGGGIWAESTWRPGIRGTLAAGAGEAVAEAAGAVAP